MLILKEAITAVGSDLKVSKVRACCQDKKINTTDWKKIRSNFYTKSWWVCFSVRGLGGGLVREGRWSAQPRKEPLPNVTNFPPKSLLKTYTYIFSFLTCTRDSSGLAKCMSRFRSSLGRCGRPQRGSPEMQKGNLRDISELIHINTTPPPIFWRTIWR